MKRALHQQGFSLLELLVAFVIMALSLSMLYRASGSSARAVGLAEHNQRASMVMESVLSMRDAVGPEGWQDAGDMAGFSWRVSSALHGASRDSVNSVKLHEISIVVSWQEGSAHKQMELQTLLPERKPASNGVLR